MSALTILVTGFGPFPGAPFNPTAHLIERLAKLRRPALADVTIIPHVFQTSYAAVDRDLPRLLVKHKPDALLMFGVAPRAKMLRIETRARNTSGSFPDISGRSLPGRRIQADGPPDLALPYGRHLLAAVRRMRARVTLSRDAGRYLCNYLCWRASEAATENGPRLAAFVHVPPVARKVLRPGKKHRASLDDLTHTAVCFLLAITTATRRLKRHL
jgi:pyroglutamyl-peptidase